MSKNGADAPVAEGARTQVRQLTLPVSGETVNYVPASMVATGMLLKTMYPRPKPPLVKVNLLGKETFEYNWADPNYDETLAQWQDHLNEQAYDMVLRRQEAVQEMDEEKAAKVARLRELYGDAIPLPADDLKVWFYSIALASNQDVMALHTAARVAGEPTEELIAAETAGF